MAGCSEQLVPGLGQEQLAVPRVCGASCDSPVSGPHRLSPEPCLFLGRLREVVAPG